MKKQILKIFTLTITGFLFFTTTALAATFSLDPASGTLIRGCNKIIKIKLDTQGEVSNGAQIYLNYPSLGGGNISLSGGLFGAYGIPPVSAGIIGLFGYGGLESGSSLDFGNITVKSTVLGGLNLTVRYATADYPSKVAQFPNSTDILTNVFSGTYTVIDGYCETNPPYLTNLNPTPDKPNHPVGQNITFDLHDDDSGINISTLIVEVRQNNIIVPFSQTLTPNGIDDKSFSVVINPNNDLIPETRVVVLVKVNDKAGNLLTRNYSFNDLTCSQLGCVTNGTTPQCSDGVDNDNDGLIDYPLDVGCEGPTDNNEFLTSDCAAPPVVTYTPQCSDGVDNDGDGLVDYPADNGCENSEDTSESLSGTQLCPVVETVIPQCRDGIDNDGDSMIDMADSGCGEADDNNEYVVGEINCALCQTEIVEQPTVGYFNLNNARFFLANRSVEIRPTEFGSLSALAGYSFTAAFDASVATDNILNVNLILGDKSYRMFYDQRLNIYLVDVAGLNEVETLSGLIQVEHGEYQKDTIPFSLQVVSAGQILDNSATGVMGVAGTTISLEQLSANDKYIKIRDVTANEFGRYSFIVPNGSYRLTVSADGYKNFRTAGFQVKNNIINQTIYLIKIVDLLATDVSISDKASYVKDVTVEEVGKLFASANDPVVENTAKNAMAPIAAASAILATAPALTLLGLLSYLRFLFLQPIFLFGRKKRKKWGVVYNVLTKLPVDLSIVRLVDVNSGKTVQSKVTDAQGRYLFAVNPGLYRIEVIKNGFIFPTKILQGYREDTNFLDIYHGEAIHVDEKYTTITANIPLDPMGAKEKTPRRIIWEARLQGLRKFVASLSIAAGILAVVISPSWWTGGLLAFQVVLYFVFKRLAQAKKTKSWGIVYDKNNKKPVDKAVARLFSKQFNKLVSTEITDSIGRYSFLAGPNDYYITVEKPGYEKAVSADIRVKEKNEVIKLDMGLAKAESAAQVPPIIQRKRK